MYPRYDMNLTGIECTEIWPLEETYVINIYKNNII